MNVGEQAGGGLIFEGLADNVAGRNDDLARLKLLFTPTENFTAKLTGIYSDSRGASFQPLAPPGVAEPGLQQLAHSGFLLQPDGSLIDQIDLGDDADRILALNPPPRRAGESWLFGGRMDWDFADGWTASSITSYVESDSSREFDADFSILPFIFGAEENEISSVTQELRFVYDREDSPFRLLFGGFYADITALNEGELFTDPGPVQVSRITSEEQITENFAFFGDVEWRVTDRLTLLAGLRYDNETVSLLSASSLVDEDQFIDAEFDAFLPKGQIVYDWTDAISTGFTYSRAYRSGGSRFDPTLGFGLPFDAEFTDNYEIAVRTSWFDNRLTVNANGFYIDWTDQQVLVPLLTAFPDIESDPRLLDFPFGIPPNLFAIANAGKSELFGAEAQADFRLDSRTNFYASFGYTRTEFIDFIADDGADFAGNEFRFAPNISAAAGVNYEHPTGFFINLNGAYSDGQFSDNENEGQNFTDKYLIVDSRIGWRHENVTLSFFANNLFDERYETFRNLGNRSGFFEGDQDQVIIGPQRFFGGQIQVRY